MTKTIAMPGIFPLYYYSLHLFLLCLASERCMQNSCVVSAYQMKRCRAFSWTIVIAYLHSSENRHVMWARGVLCGCGTKQVCVSQSTTIALIIAVLY